LLGGNPQRKDSRLAGLRKGVHSMKGARKVRKAKRLADGGGVGAGAVHENLKPTEQGGKGELCKLLEFRG